MSQVAEVSQAHPDTSPEMLSLQVVAPENGYVQTYLSNESQADINVYFDDLQVVHRGSNILSVTDYYPFGAPFQQPSVGLNGKYLYQGKEWQTDLGLNLYDFHARQYDPYLGRWWVQDPQQQFASPYLAMGNNPISLVDPDGEFVPLLIGVGMLVNVGMQMYSGNINGTGDFFAAAGVGAASGALGGGLSAGISSAIGGAGFFAAFSGSAGLASTGLTTAISSFLSGAAIGAGGGFGAGFASGLGNGLIGGERFGGALNLGLRDGLIGGLSGGALGGITGGISAVRDGRRFFDGATVQDQVLVDKQIPFVRQRGNMNCGPANCEAVSQSRGGSVTQHSIRNAPTLGGDPNTVPLGDYDVMAEFTNQSGIRVQGMAGGLEPNRALQYMRNGYDVTY